MSDLVQRLRDYARSPAGDPAPSALALLREAADRIDALEESVQDGRDALDTEAMVMGRAIQCLREIAAMGRKAGSETAQHWLLQHGYPLEDGGYVPGVQGFGDAR